MKTFRNVLFCTRVFRWCHLRLKIIVQRLRALKEYKSLYFLWHRYDGWVASSVQMGWLKNQYNVKGNWIPGINSGAGRNSWYSSLYSQLFLGNKHCLPFEENKKMTFLSLERKKDVSVWSSLGLGLFIYQLLGINCFVKPSPRSQSLCNERMHH